MDAEQLEAIQGARLEVSSGWRDMSRSGSWRRAQGMHTAMFWFVAACARNAHRHVSGLARNASFWFNLVRGGVRKECTPPTWPRVGWSRAGYWCGPFKASRLRLVSSYTGWRVMNRSGSTWFVVACARNAHRQPGPLWAGRGLAIGAVLSRRRALGWLARYGLASDESFWFDLARYGLASDESFWFDLVRGGVRKECTPPIWPLVGWSRAGYWCGPFKASRLRLVSSLVGRRGSPRPLATPAPVGRSRPSGRSRS